MKQAKKNDEGKIRVDLVHPFFIIQIAKVMEHGAAKYGEWDWANGHKWSRLYAATLRHLYAWFCNEDLDPESGLPHLAHAAANIYMLLGTAHKKDLDDRIKKEV